jgi:hypothetical protein
MIRKALLLFPALALAATTYAPKAQGQFSVYGDVTLNRLSGVDSSPILQTLSPLPCTSPTQVNCTSYKSAVDPIGFTGGVSYEFRTVGPAVLSADVRGTFANLHQGAQVASQGAGTHIYSVLGGVKATFHTPIRLFAPYVQGSVGYGRSNYGVLNNALSNNGTYPANPQYPGVPTQSNIEYHVYAGLDLRILPAFDYRIAELGYGALEATGNFGHTYPLLSVSTGIVFHIPPRQP